MSERDPFEALRLEVKSYKPTAIKTYGVSVINALLSALDDAKRERDSYKRAKAENDERFMIERDDARQERDIARAEIRALKDQLEWAVATQKAALESQERMVLRFRRLRDAAQAVRPLLLRNVFNNGNGGQVCHGCGAHNKHSTNCKVARLLDAIDEKE